MLFTSSSNQDIGTFSPIDDIKASGIYPGATREKIYVLYFIQILKLAHFLIHDSTGLD